MQLAQNDKNNLLAIDGKNYEWVSENDKAKFEQAVYFGSVALHYLNCINKHNNGVR